MVMITVGVGGIMGEGAGLGLSGDQTVIEGALAVTRA
jgi:hypothetical protein